MNRRIAAVLAAILTLSGAGSIFAAAAPAPETPEVAPDPGLSLAETVEQAMARSPTAGLPGAYAEEAAALGDRAGRLFAGPAEAGIRHQNDQWTDDRGLIEWEAELALPLWRPGQRSAHEALAGGAREMARSLVPELRLRVAGQVREALWGLMLAREQVRLTEQVRDTAAALVRDVRRRVETGDLPRTDLLLAQDEALSRKDEHLVALQQLGEARRNYIRLTGLTRRPDQPGEALSAATGINLETHPILREAEARVQRMQHEVAALRERGSGQPWLSFNTRRERAFSGEPYQDSVGIGITFPIGGRAHHAPEIAAAGRALAEAEAERNRLRRELELGLGHAEQRLATLRSELALAEERQGNAEQSLRMARIAFDVGEMDLAEFLRVQNRAQTAQADLRIRRLELKQAIAQYNQAAGDLP